MKRWKLPEPQIQIPTKEDFKIKFKEENSHKGKRTESQLTTNIQWSPTRTAIFLPNEIFLGHQHKWRDVSKVWMLSSAPTSLLSDPLFPDPLPLFVLCHYSYQDHSIILSKYSWRWNRLQMWACLCLGPASGPPPSSLLGAAWLTALRWVSDRRRWLGSDGRCDSWCCWCLPVSGGPGRRVLGPQDPSARALAQFAGARSERPPRCARCCRSAC